MADLKVNVELGSDVNASVNVGLGQQAENAPAASEQVPSDSPVSEPAAESQPQEPAKEKEENTDANANANANANENNTQPTEKPIETQQTEKPIETQPTESDNHKPSILSELSVSYFGNEQKTGMAWLGFIAFYWSVVMWIPTLLRFDFATPGFGLYCVGLIAIFAEGASLYGGYYPSGGTKESPKSYNGRGRFSAIFLVVVILVDLFTLAYIVLNRNTKLDEYFRAFCHFIALVWCSLFYYNRLLKENPSMAWTVFWEEWVDIVLTIIMVVILHAAYSDKYDSEHNGCFKSGLCSTYWSVVVIQLTGWMIPMMTIEGWGAEKHATKVSLHLFVLDLCTNVPILIAAVATEGYLVSPALFFDILWKAGGFIRSTAYFMVYYVWLQTGKRKHEPALPEDKTAKPQAQAQAKPAQTQAKPAQAQAKPAQAEAKPAEAKPQAAEAKQPMKTIRPAF